MSHDPPIITPETRIWLFKTNPKYYSHVMKPVEGGPIQQFIQNNSHVCVHYKPGDIAIVWLTGDKGKGQLISAYYTIKNIETKTQIQDAVIEDIKENEGHSFRLLDGSNRSEFIKTFEKRKQNSLQLVSAATGQEIPDSLISQKSIIGQQVRLVWRRMNRLVYGEGLHFLTSPFHLDGYNHNAYRLYKEIRPEHRDYVVQMILSPPSLPFTNFPPPPPINPPTSDPHTNHNNATSGKMAITEIVSTDPSSHSSSSSSHASSHSSSSSLTSSSHPPSSSTSHTDPVEQDLSGTLNQEPVSEEIQTTFVHEITDSQPIDISRTPIITLPSADVRLLTPLTTLTASDTNNNNKASKRKRQSSKEKVLQLTAELNMVRERLQKVENENYYLKYNLLQIASLGNQAQQGLPYIPPLTSPSPPPPLPPPSTTSPPSSPLPPSSQLSPHLPSTHSPLSPSPSHSSPLSPSPHLSHTSPLSPSPSLSPPPALSASDNENENENVTVTDDPEDEEDEDEEGEDKKGKKSKVDGLDLL